jgi:hypothetical protein
MVLSELAIFVARLQECSEIRSVPATSKVRRAIRISNLSSDDKAGWLCHEEDRWERYVLIVPIRLSNQEIPDFSREDSLQNLDQKVQQPGNTRRLHK